MAGGYFTARLPAWIWGGATTGSGQADPNPASDADLWIIYALAEGGRLWGDKRLGALATVMATACCATPPPTSPAWALLCCLAPRAFKAAETPGVATPSHLPLHQMRAGSPNTCPIRHGKSSGLCPQTVWDLHREAFRQNCILSTGPTKALRLTSRVKAMVKAPTTRFASIFGRD